MPRGKFDSTNQKHYSDLGNERHQHGISALVSQMSFGGKTIDRVAKCRLFSQARDFEQSTTTLIWSSILVRFSLRVSPHAIRESGFLNPANFCLWNPGSYTLQGGIQLKESGIALTIPIHNSGSTDKDWNLVAGLESKP